MEDRLNLVLLPGLDGTCRLLEDFAGALSEEWHVTAIDYPTNIFLTYDQLATYVKARLPDGDFMLVGESFSGPLALKLAAERPPGLKGVVLGASFARLNLPLKSVLAAASRFSARFVPMPALSWILLGRWANAKIIRLLKSVLSQVGPSVLSGRAREALTVDLLAQGIGVECPVLLLQARHDRLIPKNAVIDIGRVCPILEVKEIEGPHFLFQASYAECLSAIREFCRRLSARHGP